MATQCRESEKKPKCNYTRMYTAFLVIALLGGLIGYTIGAVYTPQKTVTVTETIEVPVHESKNLPQDTEVFFVRHSSVGFITEIHLRNLC